MVVPALLAAAAIAGMPISLAPAPPAEEPRTVALGEQPIGVLSPSFTEQNGGFSQLSEDARLAVDAGMAELILASIGLVPDQPQSAAPAPDLRWRLKPLAADYGPDGSLLGGTTMQFGSADSLAIQWRHEIDGSVTLSNALDLRHSSGPIDTQFAVIGRLSVLQGGPMAWSYRSSTTVAVLPFVSIGADAFGPLGARALLRAGPGDSMVEPHLKFTLPVFGATAGATTGWRVPTGPAASTEAERRGGFHWKLTLKKKL